MAFGSDYCCDGPALTVLTYHCKLYVYPRLGPPGEGQVADLAQAVLPDLDWAAASPAGRVEIAR